MEIVYGDICTFACDAVVNASNGIGFMGGKAGIRRRRPGVAESIHYATKGLVEREAKHVCRAHSTLGYKPGSVFVTQSHGLNCRHVIHAVTMRFPGTYSSLKTVKALLPKVLEQARALGVRSLAIPLLGTGTGHVDPNKVLALYQDLLGTVQDMNIYVLLYQKGGGQKEPLVPAAPSCPSDYAAPVPSGEEAVYAVVCPQCGFEGRPKSNYCGRCGGALQKYPQRIPAAEEYRFDETMQSCPFCGEWIPLSCVYCTKCGKKLR